MGPLDEGFYFDNIFRHCGVCLEETGQRKLEGIHFLSEEIRHFHNAGCHSISDF